MGSGFWVQSFGFRVLWGVFWLGGWMAENGTAKFAEGAEGTAGSAVFANFAVFFTAGHFCVLLFVGLGGLGQFLRDSPRWMP